MKKLTLFINSLGRGGAERVCVWLANALAETSYDITVVVLDEPKKNYTAELSTKIRYVNLQTVNARKSVPAIRQYITAHPPQICLVFNHGLAISVWLARFFSKLSFPIIARNIVHLSSEREHSHSIWQRWISFFILYVVYRRMEHFIAQSHGMAEDLCHNWGISRRKISVIHNPVSPPFLCLKPDAQRKLTNEVLFVGRLSEQKGVDRLLHAFVVVKKSIPDAKLRIVGEGPLREKLEALSRELSIDESTFFEGVCDDVIPYYRQAGVTALPSHYEGFPNVLVESLSLGTPVVSFDCPSGPAEIVEHGKNGFLVDPGDIQKFAECCVKALMLTIEPTKKHHPGEILKLYLEILGMFGNS